ncbi:MAG: hypothetical protein ACRD1Y_00860 [Terriglobales bacterium]
MRLRNCATLAQVTRTWAEAATSASYRLPHIHSLSLSNESAAPGEYSGTLSGDNLQ